MRTASFKLLAAVLAIPLCMVLTGITQNGIFLLGALAGLILSVLWAVDLRRTLQAAIDKDTPQRALQAMLAVPQALLGLVAIGFGLVLIGWILFNLLVERQPGFKFHLIALPIPFALVAVGAKWLKGAFRAT